MPLHTLMPGKPSLHSCEFQSNIHTVVHVRLPEFKLTNIGMNGTCEPADDDPWDISRDGLAEEHLPKVDLSTLYQGFLCLTET